MGTKLRMASNSLASAAAADAPPPDFVLLGASGFLGAAILQALEAAGHRVLISKVRLQDRMGLERLLDESRPTLGVICAAGERGRPNIAWCDSHPVETMDANVTGQLSIAAACYARGLHVTLLGTGGFYSGAVDRPFVEEDEPNLTGNVYLGLRAKFEELLSYFDNVLVLRVLYPVSSDLDKRGLIGKLAGFPRVDRVETSVTVLEDLCPLIPELVQKRTTGVLNFVNKGTVAYADIITALTERAKDLEWQPPRLQDASSAKGMAHLATGKLAAAIGRELPEAGEALARVVAKLPPEELQKLLVSKL